MTPDAYRTALKELGFTQCGAARVLGIGERTSRRYAAKGAPEHIHLALEGLKTRAEIDGFSPSRKTKDAGQ